MEGKKIAATLSVEVRFDEIPKQQDVVDALGELSGLGEIVQADLEIHTPTKVDLTEEL